MALLGHPIAHSCRFYDMHRSPTTLVPSISPTANPTNVGDTNTPSLAPTFSTSCDAQKDLFQYEYCMPEGSPYQQFGADHANYHDLDNTKIELRHCGGSEWAFETIAVTAAEDADMKAGTGTKMDAQDDSCHQRDIQAFSYYNTVYTQVMFCSNGYLRFGDSSGFSSYYGDLVDFRQWKTIAGIWHDFNPTHDTQSHRDLFHETDGHLEKFRWQMLAEFHPQGTDGGMNTFMVILDSSDSSISILHGEIGSDEGLVGLSNGFGSNWVSVDFAPNGQDGDHNDHTYCVGSNPPTLSPTSQPSHEGCVYGDWGAYDDCTHTCGTGVIIRTRSATEQCSSLSDTETSACGEDPCVLPCVLGDWQQWSDCSATCGTGSTFRVRTVEQSPTDGIPCETQKEQYTCNIGGICYIDGEVGDWSSWSTCTATCDGGSETRTRAILVACVGEGHCPDSHEQNSCGSTPCETCFGSGDTTSWGASSWGDWQSWGDCLESGAETCGEHAGYRQRNRNAITDCCDASTGFCPVDYEHEFCALPDCPTGPPATAPTAAPTFTGSYVPIITVVGGNIVTVEASHSLKYVDAGATCSDELYGELNVTSVGTVDRTDDRGTPHIIEYTCRNQEGSIDTAVRYVFVRDTICPKCFLDGPAAITVEASFPFDLLSAGHCNDTFASIATSVKGSLDVEDVGTYILEYTATDHSGNTDFSCGDYTMTSMTVTVVDTLKPVIALSVSRNVQYLSNTGDVSSTDAHFGEANPAATWSPNLDQQSQTDVNIGDSFLAETRSGTAQWIRFGSVGMCIAALAAVVTQRRRRREDQSAMV
jgi:hypothetical protein